MEFEYKQAVAIMNQFQPGFHTLIMAAMMRADTTNLKLLRALYPEVWEELERLYGK